MSFLKLWAQCKILHFNSRLWKNRNFVFLIIHLYYCGGEWMAIGENFTSSKSCTTRENTVTSLKLVASSGTGVFCLVLLTSGEMVGLQLWEYNNRDAAAVRKHWVLMHVLLTPLWSKWVHLHSKQLLFLPHMLINMPIKWGQSVLGSFSLALVLQRLKLKHLCITFSQTVQEFKLSFQHKPQLSVSFHH